MGEHSKRPRRYNRLSPVEWSAIQELYATGGVTLAELSEQYRVSVRSIQIHLRQSGTTKGEAAEALCDEVKAAVVSRALPTAEAIADRIRATKESAYADALEWQGFIRDTLNELKASGSAMSPSARIRVADQAVHGLERVHKLQRTILGMDREASALEVELPELPIRELTEREVAQIRSQQEEEDRLLGMDEVGAEAEDEDNEIITEGE